MAGIPSDRVFRQMHQLLDFGAVGAMSDAQLLDRFISRRDPAAEAAFEAMVIRHGPMVLRVCRSVLHNAHDAEDAFQAVFLVLANRAESIRRSGSVASWLFGVAQRVATRLKRGAARRQSLNQLVAERISESDPPAENDPDREILYDEINGLPERLRVPVVLCYLQGLTYATAAHQLGLSETAIRGRLSRARDRLRLRLTRRGVMIPASLMIAGAARQAEAAIPVKLIHSTARIALGFAAGNTAAILARGVLNSMLLHQLRVATALLCLSIGGSYWAWHAFASAVDGKSQTNPGRIVVRTPDSSRPQADRQGDRSAPDESSAPRAWFILSQDDTNGLLHGLPQRLGKAVLPSRRQGPSWEGVERGGRLELDVQVEGEALGEIFIGFFADPRWWSTEPVQVRRMPGPGRYTVDRLMPGTFQLGAMVGDLPKPRALGVHADWPNPVEVRAGATTKARLLVSTKFRDTPAGQSDLEKGFAGQWDRMDPTRMITVRNVDADGAPVPFCQVTFVDRDEKVTRGFHEIGADEQGYAYCDQIDRTFSIMAQQFDFVPEQMASRWQLKKFAKLYDAKERPLISLAWDPFPSGSGKVIGRVHDQHGRPLTQYYLNLTRYVGERLDWSDAEGIGISLPVTDRKGQFEVGGLPSGTYTAMVRHFDYPTHVWSFDGPKFTIPDAPSAVARLEVEVEAKDPLYGRALYQDGAPVFPGRWTAWFEKYDQARIVQNNGQTGRSFSLGTKPDGSFRVVLSRQEREDLIKATAGKVEIHGDGGTLGEVPIDKLSRRSDKPFEAVFPRLRPKSSPGRVDR